MGKKESAGKSSGRDGTARYRGPRIKLGYLRNLMPHEPVFGQGEDPRGSPGPGRTPSPRSVPPRPPLARLYPLRSPPRAPRARPSTGPEKREILPGIDTPGEIDREEKANRARVPRLESRTCLIEKKSGQDSWYGRLRSLIPAEGLSIASRPPAPPAALGARY